MTTAEQAPAAKYSIPLARPGLPTAAHASLVVVALAAIAAMANPLLSLAFAQGSVPAGVVAAPAAQAAPPHLDRPEPRYLLALATVEPGPAAAATPEPTLTSTPLPTNTPAPSPTPLPTNTPSPTPAPTNTPTPPPTATAVPPTPTQPAPSAPPPPADSAPTRLVAPAAGLDVPIVVMGYRIVYVGGAAATDWQVPMQAAGFHQGSAYPGRPGNTVVSGHSSSGSEVFRHLDALQVGDTVTLYVGDTPYHYAIAQRDAVQEEGASYEQRVRNAQCILPTADERLTLITCWPYPSTSHRLILVARPLG